MGLNFPPPLEHWNRAPHSPNRQWLIQIESGESNAGYSRQNRPFWRLIINHKVAINFGKLLILYNKKKQKFPRDGKYIYLKSFILLAN